MRRLVLLPGLDGTGALFDEFVRAAPPNVCLEVVALPQERLEYAELAERLAPQLRLDAETILLGESFSGPLAVHLAAGQAIGALVLCNSFVLPPGPPALAALPLPTLFNLPLPAFFIRRYLVGAQATDALVAHVRSVVASVPARVLAARVSSVLRVDVTAPLGRCTAPILYLRGTDDRVVSDASVREVVAAALVEVTVARISGPHLLLQAAPEAAWRAIRTTVLGPRADVARQGGDAPI